MKQEYNKFFTFYIRLPFIFNKEITCAKQENNGCEDFLMFFNKEIKCAAGENFQIK